MGSFRVVRVTDEAKCRYQGLVACRAALPFEGLSNARPGVAPAPPFGRCPVGDEPAIGRLGLAGELFLEATLIDAGKCASRAREAFSLLAWRAEHAAHSAAASRGAARVGQTRIPRRGAACETR